MIDMNDNDCVNEISTSLSSDNSSTNTTATLEDEHQRPMPITVAEPSLPPPPPQSHLNEKDGFDNVNVKSNSFPSGSSCHTQLSSCSTCTSRTSTTTISPTSIFSSAFPSKNSNSNHPTTNVENTYSNSAITTPSSLSLTEKNTEHTSTVCAKNNKNNNHNNEKNKKKSKQTNKQKTAESLSKEMKNYISSKSRTTAYRAACYKPTLETFQKVSFADYIRCVVLGVNVDGVESEEPYYSDESDEDDSESEDEMVNKNAVSGTGCNSNGNGEEKINDVEESNEKMENLNQELTGTNEVSDKMKTNDKKELGKENSTQGKIHADAQTINVQQEETKITRESIDDNDVDMVDVDNDTKEKEVKTIANPPCSKQSSLDPLKSICITNHQTENNHEEKNKNEKDSSLSSPSPPSPPLNEKKLIQSKSSTEQSETKRRSTRSSSRRMTTRLQTKSIPVSTPGKENIYSRPKYISPRILREEQEKLRKERKEKQALKQALKKQEMMKKKETDTSQCSSCKCASSKASSTTKLKTSKKRPKPSLPSSSSSSPPVEINACTRKVSPLSPSTQIKLPEIQKLDYDSLKLSDGIAKIIPPEGWWDYAGIGNDLTGRGKPWQSGTRLGDMIIPQPIKQCAAGIGGIYDFTMMELTPVTVSEFRRQADEYRKRQLGKELDDEENHYDDEKMDLLARKFWKRLGPTMESSRYGADMEGTLFDGSDASGWNVDRLDSCLKLLLADVTEQDIDAMNKNRVSEEELRMPGVTTSYLYFGMWASVFCAHTEDMNLLSINYLHAGAPKYWYAISTEDRGRFESLMASTFSHQSSSCKEFLRHKRSLISPSILSKAGIEYTTQVQRAGEIMITYPGSYHFGFNTGFNVAESTNFAVPEWMPLGEEARICMCHPHSVRIEMSRFKSLLNQYERDQIINARKGISKQTHERWAKENLKSRMRKRQKIDNENKESILPQPRSSKGMVVEVMKVMSGDDKSKSKKKSSKKRRISSQKKVEVEDFRIAYRVKKSSLCEKKQTPVLCLLESESEYKFFAGNVTAIVEDCARVHFVGSSRSDDVWIELTSERLFVDGGPSEKP